MRRLLLLGLWWTGFAATAQVANDNMENRRVLRLEETVTSSTVNCTVQRTCVDESLTGKCIEYHNDQWFEFTPPAAGRYFINLSQQQCRDVRGVQLVVLTGQPCQPATYQVLSCTSLGTQDDAFVELWLPQAGQPYLLDVDGYLKDFCQFQLQVSRTAQGLPAGPAPALPAEALPTTTRTTRLEWTVPDSLAPQFCRVLRRELHDFRATELAQVPVARTTLGDQASTYTWTDTLARPGHYLYQLVAAGQPPVLLQQRWVAFGVPNPLAGPPLPAPQLRLPLGKYPRKANLSVVVTNPGTGQVLLAQQLVADPGNPYQGRLAIGKWQAAGMRKIAVEITCHPRHGRFFTDHLLLDVPPPAVER